MPFTVTVKMWTEFLTFDNIRATTTILTLKRRISDTQNIPIDKQRLLYRGKFLKNEETIGKHKITGENQLLTLFIPKNYIKKPEFKQINVKSKEKNDPEVVKLRQIISYLL